MIDNLKEILEKHLKWWRGDEGGARANLARAYLAGAYLAGANLAGAYLARANLDGANLARAYLAGAYLAGANLARANLDGANLDGANLAGANLAGANLDGANLAGANLAGANLDGAKFDQDTTLTLCPLSLRGFMWDIVITDEILCIGCQRHRIDEWESFDDDRIARMHSDALAWWRGHKEQVMGLARFHQQKCRAAAVREAA